MFLKRRQFLIVIAITGLALSGCANPPNKQDMGNALGAIMGAVTGAQFGGGNGKTALTVIGGVAGWVVGGNIGKYMDNADKERAARVASQSFEVQQPVVRRDVWQNGNYQYDTRVTTQPQYATAGKTCKPFVQETTVRMGGKPETATKNGIACFEYSEAYPQGTWRIQD